MKINSTVSRKKIRGWKRRIKQVNAWGERIKQPYLKSFNEVGDSTYDRCILYPFYVLNKRHPPLWFYKLIIAGFISAFHEWDEKFKDLGLPYVLQIWLYDPSYMWSEIICRRVDKNGDRMGYFPESKIEKPFPYGKFHGIYNELKEFDWTLSDEEVEYFEDDLEYAEFTLDELIADGYIKRDSKKYGISYVKRVGDVWVGRKNI